MKGGFLEASGERHRKAYWVGMEMLGKLCQLVFCVCTEIESNMIC
jgi:hypothetical protein